METLTARNTFAVADKEAKQQLRCWAGARGELACFDNTIVCTLITLQAIARQPALAGRGGGERRRARWRGPPLCLAGLSPAAGFGRLRGDTVYSTITHHNGTSTQLFTFPYHNSTSTHLLTRSSSRLEEGPNARLSQCRSLYDFGLFLLYPSVGLCMNFEQEQQLAEPDILHPQLKVAIGNSRGVG